MDTERIDFAGFALAPNVLLVKQDLAHLDARLRSEGARPLRYRFPDRGAKGSARPFGPCVDPAQSGVDLYAGVGFGPFLDPEARRAVFGDEASAPLVACPPEETSPLFRQAGIAPAADAGRLSCNLSVYSASPFVLMVNKPLLDGRPVPTSWEDLLDERWRAQVLVTPEDPVCNMAYLGVYSMFGERGLEAFARNVACTASASVMGMLPAQPRPHTGCVYVAPWFFARCCAGNTDVACVWPREGALAFPLWLALARGASAGARAVAEYFNGDAFAQTSARLCLPTSNAASDAALPAGAGALRWVGWDFLRNLDLAAWRGAVLDATAHIKGVDEL